MNKMMKCVRLIFHRNFSIEIDFFFVWLAANKKKTKQIIQIMRRLSMGSQNKSTDISNMLSTFNTNHTDLSVNAFIR